MARETTTTGGPVVNIKIKLDHRIKGARFSARYKMQSFTNGNAYFIWWVKEKTRPSMIYESIHFREPFFYTARFVNQYNAKTRLGNSTLEQQTSSHYLPAFQQCWTLVTQLKLYLHVQRRWYSFF